MSNVGIKTTNNELVEEQVSLGIEHFLIGPDTATFDVASGTSARINIGSPPSGFRHLGAVVEDTPTVNITRETFQLKTGIPNMLRKEWTVGLTGVVNATMRDLRGITAMYALGNGEIEHHYGGGLGTDSSTVVSVTSRRVITMSTSDVSSLFVGNWVLVSAAATLSKTYNDGQIASLTTGADITDITFVDSLETLPVDNDLVAKLYATRVVAGTTKNINYALLGVADLVDGWQVIHYFPKVSVVGNWTEEVRPNVESRIPIQWNVIGDEASDVDNELVLMKRWDVRSY